MKKMQPKQVKSMKEKKPAKKAEVKKPEQVLRSHDHLTPQQAAEKSTKQIVEAIHAGFQMLIEEMAAQRQGVIDALTKLHDAAAQAMDRAEAVEDENLLKELAQAAEQTTASGDKQGDETIGFVAQITSQAEALPPEDHVVKSDEITPPAKANGVITPPAPKPLDLPPLPPPPASN